MPLLATKEDLRNTEKSLRAEMKADLQATEAKLEEAIETKLEIAIANLRTEIGEKLQEQTQLYLLINSWHGDDAGRPSARRHEIHAAARKPGRPP